MVLFIPVKAMFGDLIDFVKIVNNNADRIFTYPESSAPFIKLANKQSIFLT